MIRILDHTAHITRTYIATPVSGCADTDRFGTTVVYEPRCEKTGLRGFRPGPTQTGLFSHRRWLEAWNFGFMHQSFESPAPSGPRNSGAFNFSISKALLKALHCGATFVVKAPRKAPAPRGWQYSNEEQQMTGIIWINFLPLSHCGSTWNLASFGPIVSKKILNIHTSTYILA